MPRLRHLERLKQHSANFKQRRQSIWVRAPGSINRLLLAALLGVIIISAGLVGALYELSTENYALTVQIAELRSNITDLTSFIAQQSRAVNYTNFDVLTASQCREVGLLVCGQGVSSTVMQDPRFVAAENGLNYTYEEDQGAAIGGSSYQGIVVSQGVTVYFIAFNYSETQNYCGTSGPATIGILDAFIPIVGGGGSLDYANMSISQQPVIISCPP